LIFDFKAFQDKLLTSLYSYSLNINLFMMIMICC